MEKVNEISIRGKMDSAVTDEIGRLIFGRGKFEQVQYDILHKENETRVLLRRKREGAQEGRKA